MDELYKTDREVYEAIIGEANREHECLELIASENFVSRAVLEAMGSVMTNKYAEGYPGKRYYGGCKWMDVVENLAIERAKKLFGAEHVNVQANSGVPANMIIYSALLEPGEEPDWSEFDQRLARLEDDVYVLLPVKVRPEARGPLHASIKARAAELGVEGKDVAVLAGKVIQRLLGVEP